MPSDVRSTIGATVAGCMIAVGLSAVLGFQAFLYFQIFPSDMLRYKVLVAWIWVTDAAHTILICTAVWQSTVINYGNPAGVQQIFPALSIAVAMTAIITVTVNAFYGWRIHKMAAARYYYLRNLKQGYTMTQEVVDAVVVFTINDGVSTCAVVIATTACWLHMPNNLIWLGIYFTIAKFYSNSILATLNLRNWHRHRYVWPAQMNIPMTRPLNAVHGPETASDPSVQKRTQTTGMPAKMEVFVDHQVEYVGEFLREDIDRDTHSHSSRKSMTTS
ncbi:hypothetical protein C8R44DRAFT_878304 [Mycena epipterygia]|nr:hypothetical protein C8R44DRAFT_878304 [Mycena epipterygia]